jgi:branched-chain amino acid transport system ATP-binding protein
MGGRAIDTLPTHRRARLGLGYVSQEREIFSSLTVMENLAVAALPGGWPLDRVFALFPLLAERCRETGNRLSGGEQQIAGYRAGAGQRAEGFIARRAAGGVGADRRRKTCSPRCWRIRDNAGVTMILAEQNVDLALAFAEDALVLEQIALGIVEILLLPPAVEALHSIMENRLQPPL